MAARVKVRRPVDLSVLRKNNKDAPILWYYSGKSVDPTEKCESALSIRCSRGELKHISLEYVDGRRSSVLYCADCLIALERHWILNNKGRSSHFHAEQLIRK